MQRLINAIDKATRAGAYTLEETANILQAIDQVGAVVKQHNENEAKKKENERLNAETEQKITPMPEPILEKS